MIPLFMCGQTYDALWQQVEKASNDDLPKTRMEVLAKIKLKAAAEHAYGHLLKASLCYVEAQASVAPDSLRPEVERLEEQENAASDKVLKAVYDALLYRIYTFNFSADNGEATAAAYRVKAMENPELLATVADAAFKPLVTIGKDNSVFGGDMLSVIAEVTGNYSVAHAYYDRMGNRRGACIMALNVLRQRPFTRNDNVASSKYIASLDSLIGLYGDLDEACEAAIERYNYMRECKDATPKMSYEYLRLMEGRWPNAPRHNFFTNELMELTAPQFIARMPMVVRPGDPIMVVMDVLRNVTGINIKVMRTGLKGNDTLSPDNETDMIAIKKSGLKEQPTLSHSLTFNGEYYDYEVFADSTQLIFNEPGVYLVEISSTPSSEIQRQLIYVSNMFVVAQHLPGNKLRMAALNATTGLPVAGARLRLVFPRWGAKRADIIVDCDDKGETVWTYGNERPESIFPFIAGDEYSCGVSAYGNYYYNAKNESYTNIEIFTDRAIYRPGQLVEVAAIVYQNTDYVNNHAQVGLAVNAILLDANGKTLDEKHLTTDGYGTVHTSFLLPRNILSGNFSVRMNNTTKFFRVEEYKRPTFHIEVEKPGVDYKDGDTLSVKATAMSFSGVPVQGAKVKYTVHRNVALWWLGYSRYLNSGIPSRNAIKEVVYKSVAVTEADGTFTMQMPMVLPDDSGDRPMFYSFTADCDVTSISGETHTGSLTLPMGSKPVALSVDLKDKVLDSELKSLTFGLHNAAGTEIAGNVRYRFDNGAWKSAASNEKLSISSSQFKSGKHLLEATYGEVAMKHSFVVFSLKDIRPATDTHDWFYVSADKFANDGKPVIVQAGASDNDLYIIYSITAGDKIIEQGTALRSNALVRRELRYKPEYGSGLLLNYIWVKNGKAYQHQSFISRPLPDKALTMKWTTFRDRLKPGQQEEWRLSITDANGKPVTAQLMATLYDKSLDAISEHQWNFVPSMRLPIPSSTLLSYNDRQQFFSASKRIALKSVGSYSFSRLSDDVNFYFANLRIRGGVMRRIATRNLMMAKAVTASARMEKDSYAAPLTAAARTVVETTTSLSEDEQQRDIGEPSVRENLHETAFFVTNAETDAQGIVTLKFMLPESLTTWKFLGIAHTSDMSYGSIGAETVARKTVMVQPNVPRFVRTGDETTVTASIYNNSDAAVSGIAVIELLDPETNSIIYKEEKAFSSEGKSTSVVPFTFKPDGRNDLFVCRMLASGSDFSDGEQHYLPVLPDKEFVTVTVPVTQNTPGERIVSLEKLFPAGADKQKLTVEYTNNPVWLMVQALPSIGIPDGDNAISLAAAYYANTLANHLIRHIPSMKSIFEKWNRELGSETSLMSALEKNRELKDIVLSETPWLGDADSEDEQKHRLSDFFDSNNIGNRLMTTLDKLKALQQSDGSWSWWKGMHGSYCMTVEVAEMLVRMTLLTGEKTQADVLLSKAYAFIDSKTVDIVEQMKRDEKKGIRQTFPNHTVLQYLYLRSLDNRNLSARTKSAHSYLISLLKKDTKHQTLYDKALSAVVLHKNGDRKRALKYVKSLHEYSIYTEEMGRYYDSPRAIYSWCDYRIPTEVIAIEAISMITPGDRQTIEEMCRWLLQEKRTQAWSTPINSVNAVYAFLLNNDARESFRTVENTSISIDGKTVDFPQSTAGFGYVKTSIDANTGLSLTFAKSSEGTSWGAVYAQFVQKASEIDASASGISISREIIGELKVGARIKVKLKIKSDRDLDFVHVIDRRAACMEPVNQLSGYHGGAYRVQKDCSANYYFDRLAKGTHVIETEYFIDRQGVYYTGTATVGCAYSPEFRATAPGIELKVNN